MNDEIIQVWKQNEDENLEIESFVQTNIQQP